MLYYFIIILVLLFLIIFNNYGKKYVLSFFNYFFQPKLIYLTPIKFNNNIIIANHNSFIDFILIFSNFAASLLFALNKTLMKGRIVSHLFILNFITMIGFIILALLFENATFNSDIQRGIFGWFQFPN